MIPVVKVDERQHGIAVSNSHWLYYAKCMDKFYNEMAETMMEMGFSIWSGHWFDEASMDEVLFEETAYVDPADPCDIHKMLEHMVTKKDYKIVLNFYAPDVLNGNVTVKLKDKWFAFGRCRNDEKEGLYVSEIWPLKYVLLRIPEMEVKLRYARSIFEVLCESNEV